MNTLIASKLAAFAVALMMNSLIIGGVAYLFDVENQQHAAVVSIDRATAQTVHEAA